jgi:cytoskeletal protein CcmA (bactofilin family)
MAKGNEPEVQSNTINIIGNGTSIVGDIQSEGDIRIDGNLKGTLITKGKVVIGSTGTIVGEITCRNADISGKIEGKIKVAELLSLKSTARFNGDIATAKLAIEPNAVFTGSCNMSSTPVAQASPTHGYQQPRPEATVTPQTPSREPVK